VPPGGAEGIPMGKYVALTSLPVTDLENGVFWLVSTILSLAIHLLPYAINHFKQQSLDKGFPVFREYRSGLVFGKLF